MKAKSRRRLLISSVAMLLVAMLALGTATFAWFTTSPTANAEGIKLKATASNGLKILTDSHVTSANITIDSNTVFQTSDFLRYTNTNNSPATNATSFVLNPASYAVPSAGQTMVSGFKVQALQDDNYAANPQDLIQSATEGFATTGDVYAEKIFCKLVGATSADATAAMKLKKLDLAVADSDLAKALRIVITYNDKVVKAYAKGTNGANVENDAIPANTTVNTAYGAITAGTVTFSDWTNISSNSPTAVAIGDVGTTGTDFVKVYVYLDGEDANCTSANINMNDLITKLDVILTIE